MLVGNIQFDELLRILTPDPIIPLPSIGFDMVKYTHLFRLRYSNMHFLTPYKLTDENRENVLNRLVNSALENKLMYLQGVLKSLETDFEALTSINVSEQSTLLHEEDINRNNTINDVTGVDTSNVVTNASTDTGSNTAVIAKTTFDDGLLTDTDKNTTNTSVAFDGTSTATTDSDTVRNVSNKNVDEIEKLITETRIRNGYEGVTNWNERIASIWQTKVINYQDEMIKIVKDALLYPIYDLEEVLELEWVDIL